MVSLFSAASRYRCAVVAIGLALLLSSARAAGTWRAVTKLPPAGVDTMVLLPDGTVLAQDLNNTERWYALTPDARGSYENGTWSDLPPMHDSRQWFSSQVLTNGTFFIAGAEYGTGHGRAEIWDLTARRWRKTAPSGTHSIRDAESFLLPDGNVLMGPGYPGLSGNAGGQTLIYDVTANQWHPGPPTLNDFLVEKVHLTNQAEATWVKLADQSVLTADPLTQTSERYIPALNQWVKDADLPVQLFGLQSASYATGWEIGPAFLLADGRALFLGGSGATALYTPSGSEAPGTWEAGPVIPGGHGITDGPGAMLPDGNVLFVAGSKTNYDGPSWFYEFDTPSGKILPVSGPAGMTVPGGTFLVSMLLLPDGSVLLSNSGSQQLYTYRKTTPPLDAAKPVISSISTNSDETIHLAGLRFTGISSGASLGDDAQMDTSFPVARLADEAGHVFFGRTTRFSSTAVQAGSAPQWCDFELPGGMAGGKYLLSITANGVASDSIEADFAATPLPIVKGVHSGTITAAAVQILWNRQGGYEKGYRLERADAGGPFAKIADLSALVTQYSDRTVKPLSRYAYRLIATNEVGDGQIGDPCLIATPGTASLGSWTSMDIGSFAGQGASAIAGDAVTVLGAGRPFEEAMDLCHFTFSAITGDFSITARLTALDGANAAAGLMIRAGTAPSTPMALLSAGPGEIIHFISRQNLDGLPMPAGPLPATASAKWMRLVRRGNLVSAFVSEDGARWISGGATRVELPNSVEAGFALASGDEAGVTLASAAFDHVALTSEAGPIFALAGDAHASIAAGSEWTDPGATLRPSITAIASGLSNNLVALSGHAVEIFGQDGFAPPPSATNLVMLSSGWGHSLALTAQGRIVAWGDNAFRQSSAPAGTGFTAVAAGAFHSIAIDSAGKIRQWGDSSRGQAASSLWTPVTPVAIAAGAFFNLALDVYGELYAWGDNTYGQLEMANTRPPFIIWGTTVAIAAGGYHGLALSYDGFVHAWGDDSHGQTDTPPNATNVIAIAAGLYHSLALRADGTVVAWGDNAAGQCTVPDGLDRVTEISAAGNHSLALRSDGSLVAWGDINDSALPPDLAAPKQTVNSATTVDTDIPGTYSLTYVWTSSASGETQSVSRELVVTSEAAPALSIISASPALVLSWPATAEEYILESADDLHAAWKPVTALTSRAGPSYILTNSLSATAQFFRLRHP